MWSASLARITCLVCLGCPAIAQGVIAYPQDTDESPLANVIPLGHGILGVQGFEESRYQMLIPATHLPTRRTVVTGLAVPASLLFATVDYRRLEITMSMTAQATLGDDFDANLPAPQRVFRHTGPWSWGAGQWNEIPLDQPFELDGTGALVIEFRNEVVDSNAFSFGSGSVWLFGGFVQSPFAQPAFAPVAVGTAGGPGSGAASSAQATQELTPVQVRLLTDTPSLTVRGDPNATGVMFAIGGSAEVAVYGSPGSPYCVLVGQVFRANPLILPGVLGASWVQPIGELPLRVIAEDGRDEVNFQLPDASALVGVRVTLQAGVASLRGALTWTNGADFLINPRS